MYVDPADVDKVEAAIATTYMPPTEFPITLEAGDGWTLELKKQSRGASTLALTLANGSSFSFTTDKSQLDATNAAIDLFKVTTVSADMTAADGSGTLTLTGADGTVITLNIAKVSEKTGKDIDAEFAWADGGERIIFVASTGDEVALQVSNVTEVQTPSMSRTFAQVLLWTLIWAFFATFLNYFLGMLVAIMINKKGIKFKKLWRTILVMTIAIPQFISLLYVSKMFAADGLINGMLMNWGWIKEPLPFWTNATWAKVTIIGINIWIGIPYLMLIATGILMNIPADLYESARIDGANAFQTYMKITLPYMLFVTGPYLLTSFTGNINNFNVIFLLSGGKPTGMGLSGNAGSTDLLITWLYKMTVNDNNYKLAAVLGILVFVVCAVINLVVYNLIPSVKNEEDFQ
ncbi:MAG: sugar ABC transporter permease [Clostridia bacterium]|nr:sugar ABC transporter permease [Clostridia bacterium]